MSGTLKHTLRLWRRKIRGRLTRRLLGERGRAVVVSASQGAFAVAPEDQGVGGELLRTGRYGEDELKRLAGELSADSSLLVVGAHIGALVVPLSGLCRSVTAIEPNPDSYELLKLNLTINGVTNCETHNVAAADRGGELEFLLNRANSGGSKIVPRTRRWDYYYDKPEKISVRAVALDEYLGPEAFDVITVDIEGAEVLALRGMQRLLAGARALVIEFLPHHLKFVSGVSVAEFLSEISPHFDELEIPSVVVSVARADFERALQELYDRDQGDDGIIFRKRSR